MRLKKLMALLLCVVTASTCMGTMACNNTSSTPKQDGKTVNIMMGLAGYGTDYVQDVADAFEKAYEKEGYKINLLDARSTFQGSAALSEMRLDYDKNGFDIVFAGGVSIKQALDPEYGACVIDLDDVYSQGAINYDGSVESTPLSEVIDQNRLPSFKRDGKFYSFGVSSSARGLVYNQKVLARYGIEKAPITTDELFEQFDIIYNGTETVSSIRPVTWGGENAYGYALGTLYAGLAQLMGREAYDEYFTLNSLLNEDGTIKADGYKIYEEYGTEFKEVFEVLIQKFDVLYSYTGSKEQNHSLAHAQLTTGKTAFMQDGEYFYNEVQYDFPNYLGDIRMATNPIISYLGVMLKLDGTGNDRAKCDDILSYMCELYDNGANAASIKLETEKKFPGIAISNEQVDRVMEARGIQHADIGGSIYIMRQSPVQDIAKLFLRMLASKDAAKTFTKYGMMHAFYDVDHAELKTQFNKDAFKIASMRTYNTTSVPRVDSVRANTNMFLIPPYNAMLPVTINNEIGVPDYISDRDYAQLAENMLKKVQTNTKEQWGTLCSLGGYKLG